MTEKEMVMLSAAGKTTVNKNQVRCSFSIHVHVLDSNAAEFKSLGKALDYMHIQLFLSHTQGFVLQKDSSLLCNLSEYTCTCKSTSL